MIKNVRTSEEVGAVFYPAGPREIAIEKLYYIKADGVVVSGALADIEAVDAWLDKHGLRGDVHEVVTTFYAETTRPLAEIL